LARIEAGLPGGGQDFVCGIGFFGVRNPQRNAAAGAIWPAHIYKVSAPRMAAATANVAELGFAAQQNGLTWINVSVYSLE